MKERFAATAALALLCLGSSARANVFDLGPGLTDLKTVFVGDPGNTSDTQIMIDGTTGYGGVGYSYRMGTYEVTAGQYCDFLNHKAKSDPHALYNPNMDSDVNQYGCNIKRTGASDSYTYSVTSDWANRPVNFVSYWDACRFANWLHNGQRDGDTETGAYTMNGYTGTDGRWIQRNPGAAWFVPSEDEWYKAAYYKGGGTNAGYWDYPTQSDSMPSNALIEPDPGNNANTNYTIGYPYYRTNVGEFENSETAYGTYDQGGNVYEFNEALLPAGSSCRGVRGSFFSGTPLGDFDSLHAYFRHYIGPSEEEQFDGFRVAAAATVPEPSSLLALAGSLVSVLGGLGRGGLVRRRRW
jgi:sulfatase modifying factor 1